MSYFEDVYLKRMNIDGDNYVDRIKTRKEKEFDELFLKKTKYRTEITQINDDSVNIICSLSPNRWNENELLSNFLLSTKSQKLKTGDLVYTSYKVKENIQNKKWLILFIDDNLTYGYSRYQAVCLDEEINFTDEYGDTLRTYPVKIVNSSTTFLKDIFNSSTSRPYYREPNAQRRIICQDSEFLRKDLYFEYREQGWKISGIDRISIENIAYISAEENLLHEPEPKNSEEILVGKDINFFLN